MVLTFSADHSNSPVLLNTVIDVPVVQGVQVVDITVVVQRPVPMVRTVCRTIEFTLLLHTVIDVPVVQVVLLPRWWSRRAVNCGAPQLQFSDKVVICLLFVYDRCCSCGCAVAVITQRQVWVSRTVEVPQIQFIAQFEDIPVAQQHSASYAGVAGCGRLGGCDEGFFAAVLQHYSASVHLDVEAQVAGTPGVSFPGVLPPIRCTHAAVWISMSSLSHCLCAVAFFLWSLADSHGRHGRTRGCVVSQTTPGSPAPSMAPSRPYDGGHGAGDGPPPQRSRSEEKSGGGVEGGGAAREAQRNTVGRVARASVGCLCAAAAGRSYVCGCWCSSPRLVAVTPWTTPRSTSSWKWLSCRRLRLSSCGGLRGGSWRGRQEKEREEKKRKQEPGRAREGLAGPLLYQGQCVGFFFEWSDQEEEEEEDEEENFLALLHVLVPRSRRFFWDEFHIFSP